MTKICGNVAVREHTVSQLWRDFLQRRRTEQQVLLLCRVTCDSSSLSNGGQGMHTKPLLPARAFQHFHSQSGGTLSSRCIDQAYPEYIIAVEMDAVHTRK